MSVQRFLDASGFHDRMGSHDRLSHPRPAEGSCDRKLYSARRSGVRSVGGWVARPCRGLRVGGEGGNGRERASVDRLYAVIDGGKCSARALKNAVRSMPTMSLSQYTPSWK